MLRSPDEASPLDRGGDDSYDLGSDPYPLHSPSSVEPVTSQNRRVTVLRSATLPATAEFYEPRSGECSGWRRRLGAGGHAARIVAPDEIMSAEGSKKAIVAALLANAGIAVAKFVAFFITSSASMLAEAIHSVADSSNQGLLLLGGSRARRSATPQHPFGFGRERYFWSFVVALVLFTLGGIFALFEGIEKLRHPHEVGDLRVALAVLALAIVLEFFSLRTAVNESRRAKGAASWWHFVRTSRTPELPVVLLEDIGAMVGLVVALVAVSAAGITHNPALDAVGTISIGVLLLVIAVFLMIEMKGLLIGERALPGEEQAIKEALESHPQVRSVIHMRTQHLGPEDLLVGVKIALEPDLDLVKVADAINDAEAAVREAVPAAKIIYVEPDLLTPASADGAGGSLNGRPGGRATNTDG